MINLDTAVEAAHKTFEVVVKSDEDGSKAGFNVVGSMSEQYGKARRELDIAGVKLARSRKGKAINWEGDEGDEFIAEQRSIANMIVAKNCVVNWFGFYVGKEDPQPLEFTSENLEKVLKLFPAFVERIALEVQNDENFM
jgi:hypothetical protein